MITRDDTRDSMTTEDDGRHVLGAGMIFLIT